MSEETRTMQTADTIPARAPEDTPALVKKIGKTTYKVHVHFSNTSTETMSDKIKRIPKLSDSTTLTTSWRRTRIKTPSLKAGATSSTTSMPVSAFSCRSSTTKAI